MDSQEPLEKKFRAAMRHVFITGAMLVAIIGGAAVLRIMFGMLVKEANGQTVLTQVRTATPLHCFSLADMRKGLDKSYSVEKMDVEAYWPEFNNIPHRTDFPPPPELYAVSRQGSPNIALLSASNGCITMTGWLQSGEHEKIMKKIRPET